MQLKINEIYVPEERQRKEFTGITELKESIKEHGQLQPIIVDSKHTLIAGERRLKALQGLQEEASSELFAEVKIIDPDDEYHRHAIELEENIKREPLTPPERAQAIAQYHRLQQVRHGAATRGAKGGHGILQTADELKQSKSSIGDMLIIDKILQIAPHLKDAKTLTEIRTRWRAEKIKAIRMEIAKRAAERNPDLVKAIQHQDGLEFMRGLADESVDLLIADVEYGIEVFKSSAFRDQQPASVYSDSQESADAFLRGVIALLSTKLRTGSHAFIFAGWKQMEVIRAEVEHWTNLTFDEPPWIWDKQNPNMSTVPSMQGDRQYEVFAHLYKDSPTFPDRLGTDLLHYNAPLKPVYPTEKPRDLVTYLIRLCTIEDQLVIDPCCGSGTTVVCALKHSRRGLGVDSSEDAVKIARSRLVTDMAEQEMKDA